MWFMWGERQRKKKNVKGFQIQVTPDILKLIKHEDTGISFWNDWWMRWILIPVIYIIKSHSSLIRISWKSILRNTGHIVFSTDQSHFKVLWKDCCLFDVWSLLSLTYYFQTAQRNNLINKKRIERIKVSLCNARKSRNAENLFSDSESSLGTGCLGWSPPSYHLVLILGFRWLACYWWVVAKG